MIPGAGYGAQSLSDWTTQRATLASQSEGGIGGCTPQLSLLVSIGHLEIVLASLEIILTGLEVMVVGLEAMKSRRERE